MLLLLLLALQTPAERTLENAVAAFANGDDAARAEILKAGACSIRPLLKSRDRSAERIDALLYDLKKAAAGFDTKALLAALEGRRSIDLPKAAFCVAHDELSNGFPLLFDPALFGTHYDAPVALKFDNRPRREILEELCRQLKLDYGFFYGIVLIAAPDRLWPAGPPPRVKPLAEEEARRAVVLVERLASDRVDEREDAIAALKKLGEGVIPLLEKGPRPADGEAAARLRDLIAQLRSPPPAGVFHLPAAARQTLAGNDEVLLKSLKESQVSFKVADINLDGAMRLMLGPRQIGFQLGPALKKSRITLDLQNQSAWTVISIATHTAGFDFMIQDGMLLIDTREEIERRLAAGR